MAHIVVESPWVDKKPKQGRVDLAVLGKVQAQRPKRRYRLWYLLHEHVEAVSLAIVFHKCLEKTVGRRYRLARHVRPGKATHKGVVIQLAVVINVGFQSPIPAILLHKRVTGKEL
jgi:hypothetical protein